MRFSAPHRHRFVIALVLAAIAAEAAFASRRAPAELDGSAYFRVPVASLKLTEGNLPGAAEDRPHWAGPHSQSGPRAWVDGGEAFVGFVPSQDGRAPGDGQGLDLVVRVGDAGKDVNGLLFMPAPDGEGMVRLAFTIPATNANPEARAAFLKLRLNHFDRLADAGGAGAAWFRHQADQSRRQLGETASGEDNTDLAWRRTQRRRADDAATSSYDLFTGARAVAENLQLDRALRPATQATATELVDDIFGIEAAAIDWTPLVKDLKPALDPLASLIPIDQHAIFFPTFDMATRFADAMEQRGSSLLVGVESRSEDTGTRARYERQLGLPVGVLSKILGPTMIDSLAVTGGDPYLRSGSDLAVIFQTKQPEALHDLLVARLTLTPSASEPVRGRQNIDGLNLTSFASPDRSVSSYIAIAPGAVIVSNSPIQIARLAAVVKGRAPSLATAPEYVYFRDRYPLGAKDETAFLMLTDATIRRWCGPRTRIGAARRIRAAAVMSDLQARHAADILSGSVKSPVLLSHELATPDMGDLVLTAGGVRSSAYGSLDFLRPIAELEFDRVSTDEKTAYEMWRNQYASNWRWAFDPIAAKLSLGETGERIGLDLSVRPLIAGSDFRPFLQIAQGVTFDPLTAGDPHVDALGHAVLALNMQAPWLRSSETFVRGMMPGLNANPFAWVGTWGALFADDDPFWKELGEQKADDANTFMQQNLHRLPVALAIENTSALKLTAFLAGLRGAIEQSAPNMVMWTTLQHGKHAYVKIEPSADARRESREIEKLAVYYAATPRMLVVTLSEDVLKRALDRYAARMPESGPTSGPAVSPQRPIGQHAMTWLGSSMAMRVRSELIELFRRGARSAWQFEARQRSWANIAILNEWHQNFPAVDSIEVHRRLWATTPLCPAGGSYVWNERWKTFQSSVAGHPGEPKELHSLPPVFEQLRSTNAGVTFEHEGLRAVVEVELAPPKR